MYRSFVMFYSSLVKKQLMHMTYKIYILIELTKMEWIKMKKTKVKIETQNMTFYIGKQEHISRLHNFTIPVTLHHCPVEALDRLSPKLKQFAYKCVYCFKYTIIPKTA